MAATTKIKTKRVTFKHIESEWYNYHQTLKEIAKLRSVIANPYNEDPDDRTVVKGSNSVRQPGRPTERIATRLATNKQLEFLSTMSVAIEQVYNALPDDYKKLVRIRYWSNKRLSWMEISEQLHVHKVTANRWRNEIIQATAEVIGWV